MPSEIIPHNVFDVTAHPTWTLLPASFVLSFLSLSLTPSFVSLVCHLTSLHLYARGTLNQSQSTFKAVLLWLTLTVSISLSHLGPSIHALSTPSTSILSLVLLSSLSSAVALVPIYLSHNFRFSGYPQSIVFPSLWATTWLLVSWISPIGRLITWTPLYGNSSYRWILQYLGFAGLDWITAAWAGVAAEMMWGVFFIPVYEASLLHFPEIDETRKPAKSRSPPIAVLLLALALPSFFISPLPLPPISTGTTPLRVACILPEPSQDSQLDRFIKETKTLANVAKVLLWPESAVTFETDSDKQLAFETFQAIASQSKVWIGVSFEERVSGTGTSTRDGQRLNGMALIGPEGVEMTYNKRKLVPIAESFSQIASTNVPPVHNIDLPRPNHWSKEAWGPSDTRAIPLSASICLDFSAPLTLLDSRPALVLAPAKTWHIGVGRAMYELARARGDEIGADVLWCDGGAGGLSGVAGDTQVGTGSWFKVIGVPYPFAETQARTVYATGGDWLALAAVLGVPALFLGMRHNVGQIGQRSRSIIAWTRDQTRELVAGARRAIAPAHQQQQSQEPRTAQLIDTSA